MSLEGEDIVAVKKLKYLGGISADGKSDQRGVLVSSTLYIVVDPLLTCTISNRVKLATASA